ncbi:MAG: protein translocase subunit SecF [Patescibacteria group bacterium]
MFDIIGKRKWYFLFSFLMIVPGVVSLFLWGLNLSIDFTGGSRTTLVFPQPVNEQKIETVEKAFEAKGIDVVTIQPSGDRVVVRTKPLDDKQNAAVLVELKKTAGEFTQDEFETIGPVIGQEITLNAFKAIGVASLVIIFYIAWSFRGVRKPASSWRFGVCAIAALIHDALFVIGVFSILGHFFGVEVDSLFVTAILTVIGFSVHDTIVVFDRIRENLKRTAGVPFGQVVNDSLLQTLVRSLNTSWTTLLVLFTLLLFGGETIRWFVFALFIGMLSGTYSSIFNAAQLLVAWQDWIEKRKK